MWERLINNGMWGPEGEVGQILKKARSGRKNG